MEQRHIDSAVKILKSLKYMTIATVCEDGSPWNTPVAPNLEKYLVFTWGSNENSVHSQNVRRDKRVFVVVYDSHAEEGAGEGVYMKGEAQELDRTEGVLKMYKFVPQKIWINDEEQDEDGNFIRDVRVELDLEVLRNSLNS